MGKIEKQEVDCEFCDPSMMSFQLDNGKACYSVTMGIILQCVRIAEVEGHVPALPVGWWTQIQRRYHDVKVNVDEYIQIKDE